MKKRIVIVDDHASVRDMLACILRREPAYEIVGEAGTGMKALEICASQQPDLMILDLVLPELSGTEVMRRLGLLHPLLRVLVYSGTFNHALVIEALRCKPHGFVEKSDTLDTLRQAISTVASGGSYFTQYAADFFKSAHTVPCETCDLTAREREILQLVAEGQSNKDISRRLGVANKTVENHRAHLMGKLHIHDIASLTRYAVRHGIITVE